MGYLRRGALWVALVVFVGCSGGSSGTTDADSQLSTDVSTADVTNDASDGTADLTGDTTTETDSDGTSDSGDGSDSVAETQTTSYELKTQFPISPPSDPLTFANAPTSCAIYQETQCSNGVKQRCAIYDVANKQFVETPDPLLERVFLYGRWYDKYHSPDGQRMERLLNTAPLGDTPESVWGDPDNFKHWLDNGDSAIFTGGAVTAQIFRYLATGTKADYQRMEAGVRGMLTFFDVTGIPGYLARYHYLYFDGVGEVPKTDQHVYHSASSITLSHRDFVIANPNGVPDLPQDYLDRVAQNSADLTATPMWQGNPSIDQYTGPWLALPLAFTLLTDETLKQRIVTQLTCYLKRLRRLEVINLKQNSTVAEALTDLLATGGYELKLDPGDPDLTQLDRVVAYYLPAYNSESAGEFDASCPDTVQLTPTRVIDASASDWLAQGLELFEDLKRGEKARKTGIDHMYIVNVRGGDAMHLMHMAAVAYQLTGDSQYKTFLEQELIGKLQAQEVAKTLGALILPDWCYSFYGDHITIPPLWGLITFLADSPLKTAMQQVMETEGWQKRAYNQRNLKYNVLYAGSVPPSIASERDVALQQLTSDLPTYGGNVKGSDNSVVLNAPRRNAPFDEQGVIDALNGLGIGLRGPTDEERTLCESGASVLGISFGGTKISTTCPNTLGPLDHVMSDGMCVRKLAASGLPASLLRYEGFQWQRSTFEIKSSGNGREQAPGISLLEPFWIARHYGFVDVGKQQVLAWESTNESCTP